MTSDTPTPSAVSELVAPTPTESNTNVLREPIIACIDSGVQAYAKLEGEDFYYYVCKLQVSLGRKVSVPETVDVPLGNTKSVSRQHARLYYNFSLERFELTIFGKNGAFVNEQFIERGVTVPLGHKTKIQIGEMAFVFLLPPRAEQSNSNHVNTSNNQNSTSKHNIEELGYISTPHQLEKVVATTSSSESVPNDLNDESSIKDEDAHFHNSKDIKPPYSYASLIAQAINSSRDKRMTLNGIYKHITTNYPYYQMTQNGWQNSIRHNLSLNKAFIKVARSNSEPGKGAFWMIDSNTEAQLAKGLQKRQKRPSQQYDSQATIDCDTDNVRKKMKKEHNGLKVKLRPKDPDNNEELSSFKDIPSGAVNEREEEQATHHHVNSNITDILSSKEIPSTPDMEKTTELLAVSNDTFGKDVTDVSKVKTSSTPINDDPVPDSIASSSASTNKKKRKKAKSQQQNGDAQAQQLQEQLHNTIRQHLLDPVLYPLPPSIAQLLPQAIAQLPPELATQFSSSVQKSLAAKTDDSSESWISSTKTVESSVIEDEIRPKNLQTDEALNPTSTDDTVIDSSNVQKAAKTEPEDELLL